MTDIQLTENGDVDLSGGDMQYGESTGQHKADILVASKGDYGETPETGVGAVNYLKDESPNLFLRSVSREMMADGIKVKRVAFDTNGELLIDGEYENGNG